MWDWDTMMVCFAGSDLARRLRMKQFQKEVWLAGIAQEERAQSAANSMRTSGVTSRQSFSPARSSTPSRYSTPVPSYAPSRSAFCHPVHHEVPIPPATVKDVKNRCASVERVDSAATSRVSTPQHSRTASPGSTRKSVESSARSNSPSTSDQIEDPDWVGIGRFRHPSKADPEWIKAKLDNELQAPGALSFFGPEGNLGVHPLEEQYRERRKSMEKDDSIQVFTQTPIPEFVPCHVRLEEKFRTEPSTIVTPDGCVITKGFVVSPRPSAPPSRVPTPINNTVTVEPQPKPQVQKPKRRITWDERTITRFDNVDIAGAVRQESDVSNSSSAGTRSVTAPHKVGKQPKRSNSADVPRRTGMQTVTDNTWSTDSTTDPTPRPDTKVKIVCAAESENAIVSEDEDSVRSESVERAMVPQQRVVLRPSKRLTPPAKGILKRPSRHTMSTESSENATHSDELGTNISNKATKPAQ